MKKETFTPNPSDAAYIGKILMAMASGISGEQTRFSSWMVAGFGGGLGLLVANIASVAPFSPQLKAGPSIPLINQAIAGASTGTFDIEISDQWEKDGPKFLAKFPVLNSVPVQKRILPAFDRVEAQKWWEAH